MTIKLPDAAVACIVVHLQLGDWGKLMCASRGTQQQLLRVLATTPVQVSIDGSSRKWKAALHAVSSWCGHVAHFSLATRHLSSLQSLQPLLQPQLTHLSLQGLNFVSEGCHARELVNLLLQHCPALEHLDLQDCDLPHLGVFQRLIAPAAAQHWARQHLPADAVQAGLQVETRQSSSRGLKVLQLTGARLAPGPSTDRVSTKQFTATTAAAHNRPADSANGQDCNSSRPAHLSELANLAEGGHGFRAEQGGLQELHLGCQGDLVDTAWLHQNNAVSSSDVITLLQYRCQVLQVLDLSKRPSITDELLEHLAAHHPTSLHTLDISLTQVTPDGLVTLLQHCPQLRVLRYACRSGNEGLNTESAQRLAAVLPAVQELDLSLHPHLNDGCLEVLAHCKTLRKVSFARSHKMTQVGLERLVTALPVLQEITVVRCMVRVSPDLAKVRPGLVVHT